MAGRFTDGCRFLLAVFLMLATGSGHRQYYWFLLAFIPAKFIWAASRSSCWAWLLLPGALGV
jgi:hypothetical protein